MHLLIYFQIFLGFLAIGEAIPGPIALGHHGLEERGHSKKTTTTRKIKTTTRKSTTTTRKVTTTTRKATTTVSIVPTTIVTPSTTYTVTQTYGDLPTPSVTRSLPPKPWPTLDIAPPPKGWTQYAAPPAPKCFYLPESPLYWGPYVHTPATVPAPADPVADLIARRDACLALNCLWQSRACGRFFALATEKGGTYCVMGLFGLWIDEAGFRCDSVRWIPSIGYPSVSGPHAPSDLGMGIVYNSLVETVYTN